MNSTKDEMHFKPFPFLDLPPELREKVYQYYYKSSGDEDSYTSLLKASEEYATGLLMTCHQIYSESRQFYFSLNSFSVTIRRDNQNREWSWFLQPNFRDNRLLVSSLRFTIYRYGSKDWFSNKFLPAIEDMILNGRLRELEVRIPQRGIYDPNNNNETLEIKRLCEDPFLTNVVVKCYSKSFTEDKLGRALLDSEISKTAMTNVTWQLDRPKLQDGTGTWPWTCRQKEKWDDAREERRKTMEESGIELVKKHCFTYVINVDTMEFTFK